MSETPTVHSDYVEDTVIRPADVVEAEERFNALARQLSRQSFQSQRTRAEPEGESKGKDLEKGISEEDESGEDRFDLREYLASSNGANEAHGIKHKHVGVTWEDLQVEVTGGVGYKVRVLFDNA